MDQDNIADFPADRRLGWSIRRLAEELGHGRDTLQKRIAEAHLKPCATVGGHPQYRLCDVVGALYGPLVEDRVFDPRELKPMERRAWFQSERERLALMTEARELITTNEVRDVLKDMVGSFLAFLLTLPDNLERRGLPPDMVEPLADEIDRQREALYQQMQSELSNLQPEASDDD
jgi:hypothetical protein